MSLHMRRILRGAMATAALAVSAQLAHASEIPGTEMSLYSGSKLVIGNSASVLQFQVPSAGVLSLTWSDLDFSSSLGSLDLGLSDALKSLGNYQGAGSTTLDLTGPVTLYAAIFATAQGSLNVGLYHLTATFAPAVTAVPLPNLGIWGLGAAFLSLLALGLRRGRLADRAQALLGAGFLGLLALGWRRGWQQPDFSGSEYKIVTTPVA